MPWQATSSLLSKSFFQAVEGWNRVWSGQSKVVSHVDLLSRAVQVQDR